MYLTEQKSCNLLHQIEIKLPKKINFKIHINLFLEKPYLFIDFKPINLRKATFTGGKCRESRENFYGTFKEKAT